MATFEIRRRREEEALDDGLLNFGNGESLMLQHIQLTTFLGVFDQLQLIGNLSFFCDSTNKQANMQFFAGLVTNRRGVGTESVRIGSTNKDQKSDEQYFLDNGLNLACDRVLPPRGDPSIPNSHANTLSPSPLLHSKKAFLNHAVNDDDGDGDGGAERRSLH